MKLGSIAIVAAVNFGTALVMAHPASAQSAAHEGSYELTCKGTAEPVDGSEGRRVDALIGVKIDGVTGFIHLPPDMVPTLHGPSPARDLGW